MRDDTLRRRSAVRGNMKTIAWTPLRAKLLEYLTAVSKGATLLVTRKGVPLARISPPKAEDYPRPPKGTP